MDYGGAYYKTYVTLNFNEANTYGVSLTAKLNIHFNNLHFTNLTSGAGTRHLIYAAGSIASTGLVCNNCIFDYADYAISGTATFAGMLVLDCSFYDNLVLGAIGMSNANYKFINNRFFTCAGVPASVSAGTYIGNVFSGGAWGIYCGTTVSNLTLINNVFYGQTTGCVHVNSTSLYVVDIDNIFNPATDTYAISRGANGGDIIYSNFSCAFSVTPGAALSAAWPIKGANSIELDPQFIDAAGDDFRLKTISPCLNTGLRLLGRISMGVFQPRGIIQASDRCRYNFDDIYR